MDTYELLELIEDLRQHLAEITKNKGLTDPEVVKASQALDKVLNEYCELIRKKRSSD